MTIGIIGAMDIEIKNLLDKMENKKEEPFGKLIFYKGKINGINCVLVKCGVGKVNAAVCTQTLILKYLPDVIINIGVAGGIAKGIEIGDIVISSAVVQHDMNTCALGDEIGFISGLDKIYIEADKNLSEIIFKYAENIYKSNVHRGVIASGDIFVADTDMMKKISESFNAYACEMEGAGIGQTCYINEVPFVIIRSISDSADSHAEVDFMRFAQQSANRYGELIFKVLPYISSEWRK